MIKDRKGSVTRHRALTWQYTEDPHSQERPAHSHNINAHSPACAINSHNYHSIKYHKFKGEWHQSKYWVWHLHQLPSISGVVSKIKMFIVQLWFTTTTSRLYWLTIKQTDAHTHIQGAYVLKCKSSATSLPFLVSNINNPAGESHVHLIPVPSFLQRRLAAAPVLLLSLPAIAQRLWNFWMRLVNLYVLPATSPF